MRQAEESRPDVHFPQHTGGEEGDRTAAGSPESKARAALNRGDMSRTIEFFQSALSKRPRHPGLWIDMAVALEKFRRFEEAYEAAARAAKLAPRLAFARVLLGRIGLRLDRSKAILILEDVLQELVSDALKVQVQTLLADDLRNAGQHVDAYRRYVLANEVRAQMPTVAARIHGQKVIHPESLLGVEQWANEVEQADIRSWPKAKPPEGEGHPVFLLGFPCSGTSFLKSVLYNHPRVRVQNQADTVASILAPLRDADSGFPNLSGCEVSDLVVARQAYRASSDVELDSTTESILAIDELPFGLPNLPVLNRIFPDAFFILCLRDPRDACLSCFMHDFESGPSASALVGLESIARYHAAIFRIVQTVIAQLSPRMIIVRYEDVVENFMTEMRRIVDALQIAWSQTQDTGAPRYDEQSILAPYTPVHPTHSRSSVGRWRSYPEAIRIMAPYLDSDIRRYGYEATKLSSTAA